MGGNLLLELFLISLLILINAFFSSAEIALITINDSKMKKMAEKGDKKAAMIVSFLEKSSKFLSTIQVGVTFSGFLSSAFAADSMSKQVVDIFIKSGSQINENLLNTISVIAITLVLSFFTLVFGELVPKRLAMKRSEQIAFFCITPLKITSIVFSPFIALLTFSVNAVLKLFGIGPEDYYEDVTEEEILFMVNEGQEKGVLGDEESEMINNVLDFNDTTAGNIMTHRTEILAISLEDKFNKVLDIASNEKYSRFPVYKDRIDNIVGILHIKDLLKIKDDSQFELQKIMRSPCYVPESQKIDYVFKILKQTKNHLAVVVDEYGGTAGIITMEDILEELVGSIMDEYDTEEEESINILQIDNCTYMINGMSELEQVNDTLGIDLPTDDYETLSGFVISELGYIPDEDEHPEFMYEAWTFKVETASEKIINTVKVSKTLTSLENIKEE